MNIPLLIFLGMALLFTFLAVPLLMGLDWLESIKVVGFVLLICALATGWALLLVYALGVFE